MDRIGKIKKFLLIVKTALILFSNCAQASDILVLENMDVKILFEAPLAQAAKEVADLYPHVRAVLEKDMGWNLGPKPMVLLIRDREHIQYMAANPLIVGFAVPNSNMIVIDYTKMTQHPFSIDKTLKHELCHLLLHHHIPREILPKWLDEGVCQWMSDWIGDIIMGQKRSYLNRASIKGTLFSLRSLKDGFPREKEAMLLAYEESKSFVSFIIGQFGKEGMLSILEHMEKGQNVEQAFLSALDTPLEDLEIEWRYSIKNKMTWLTQLSNYLYEILFGLTALIAIFAFIKIILKKRAYMAEDAEDDLLS